MQSEAQPAAWSVYILRCADGSLYAGATNDLQRRVVQHNAGTASRYTRGRRPVSVAYREAHPSRSAALKRELEIKSMPRPQKERLIRNFAGSGGVEARPSGGLEARPTGACRSARDSSGE